ncbi:hypothetical protein [Clostridium saccharoperbutylacetonicum]|uniref:hypothetical protein n=1 Tax=Clostridium saccharoperbutylacetonicum TaxID=36745 RepID=UPI0039ECD68E
MWPAPVTSVILVPELLFIALRYRNPIQGILSEVLGIKIIIFRKVQYQIEGEFFIEIHNHNLNIHYSLPNEIWKKLAELYKENFI